MEWRRYLRPGQVRGVGHEDLDSQWVNQGCENDRLLMMRQPCRLGVNSSAVLVYNAQ